MTLRPRGTAGLLALAFLWSMAAGCRRHVATPAPPHLPALPENEVRRLEAPVQEDLRALQRAAEDALRPPVQQPATAEKLASLGAACIAYELYDHAEAALSLAESLAPADPKFPYYLGHLYERSGRRALSIAAFRRAIALQGGFLPAKIWLARALIDGGRAPEAEALLRPELDRSANVPALRFELGRAAAADGKNAEARDHLEAAARLAPTADEIHYPLGLVYRRLGLEEEARRLLEQRGKTKVPLDDPFAAELDRHVLGSRLHVRKGNESFARRDFPSAILHFEAAVAAAPDDVDALRNLTAALFAAGRLDAALERAREMTERHPGEPESWFQLATVFARLGRDADALPPYRRCLAIDDARLDARFNMANALRRLHRSAEAEVEYRRIVERSPASMAARLGLATVEGEQGRWDGARKTLEDGVRAEPGSDLLNDALARLLAACPKSELRDGRRSLRIATALLEKEKSVAHLETIAMALAEIGQFQKAAAQQRIAVAAARAAHRQDLVNRLMPNLALFERNRPSRTPFS